VLGLSIGRGKGAARGGATLTRPASADSSSNVVRVESHVLLPSEAKWQHRGIAACRLDAAWPGNCMRCRRHALDLLARDRMQDFQELADEAFRDLLQKHGRPTDLKTALRQSASGDAVIERLPKKSKGRPKP
jgi:hypothetical protein